ncbi:mevalonate kinase [Sporosarcina sp. USHLN248]|uniref:mevalonate kinase n=1 Tax=Sporosarcina sp. USHLN248 TaxID=3081300 RepID=UPI0030163C85
MSNLSVGAAHGKIILIGEHAVVYNKPAIAIPFTEVGAKAIIQEGGSDESGCRLNCKYFCGPFENAPEPLSGITACVHETLSYLQVEKPNITIRIESSIPSGRGLGSSAAIAYAVVKGLFRYYGHQANEDEILRLAQVAEIFAHGNPSGIDVVAVGSEGPIRFQKGKGAVPLPIGKTLHLVIADTGRFGDTRTAVESIRTLYEQDRLTTQRSLDLIEDFTYHCEQAMAKGDVKLVGCCLNLAQEELSALGVSDEGIDRLVDVARDSGALGAKLTGGGRGGCILALAADEQDALQLSISLKEAGATETYISRIGMSQHHYFEKAENERASES